MCQTEKKGNGPVDKFLGHARVPAKAESVSHNLINWVMPGVTEFKLLVIRTAGLSRRKAAVPVTNRCQR